MEIWEISSYSPAITVTSFQSPVRANLKATFSEVLPESLPQRLTPIIFKAFFGAEKCHQKDLVERQILLLGSSVTTPAEIKMLS